MNCFSNLLNFLIGRLTVVKVVAKDKNQKKPIDAERNLDHLPAGALIYISKALQQIDLQVVFQKTKHNFVTTDDAEEINEIAFDSEKWKKCIYEKIPQMKERYNAFAIQLRKLYIDAYSEQINDILYQYFADIKEKENKKMAAQKSKKSKADDDTYNDEPANITLEFQKISDLFFKQILKELTLSEFAPIMQKCAQNNEMVTQILEKAPKPALLTNSKQFSQIEMEMDMFLAKKSQIFNTSIFQMEFNKKLPKQERKQQQGLANSEYVLAFNMIKSILHLALKSMYEIMRQ